MEINSTASDAIAHALADPGTSHWLKQALTAALQRDPVDAANDAARLQQLLHEHANDVLRHTAAAAGIELPRLCTLHEPSEPEPARYQ